jgi:hypothetical protein
MAEFLVGKQQRPPNDFYEITFGDLLDQRAEEYGDKEAIGYYSQIDKKWSYQGVPGCMQQDRQEPD